MFLNSYKHYTTLHSILYAVLQCILYKQNYLEQRIAQVYTFVKRRPLWVKYTLANRVPNSYNTLNERGGLC